MRFRVVTVLLAFCLAACGKSNPGAKETTPHSTTPTGNISIRSVASGQVPKGASLSIDLDGTTGGPIALDGGTFGTHDAPIGDHKLTIGNVPPNCAVAGGNSRTVTVKSDSTTAIDLVTSCK